MEVGRVQQSDLAAISQLHVHFWDEPSDVGAMAETLRLLADDPDHLFHAYGATQDEAVAHVQALALRVVADRLERDEAGSDYLNISFNAA